MNNTLYPLLEGLILNVPALFPHVISSHFDADRSRFGGAYDRVPVKKHEGPDFAPWPREQTDLPVRACLPGYVIWIGEQPNGYGKHIVIEHWYNDERLVAWYAHLKEIFVKRHDVCNDYDVIAQAGSTGLSTASHLHLSVQYPGKGLKGYVLKDVINPEPYLVAG